MIKDKALSNEEMSMVHAGVGKGFPACWACYKKLYPDPAKCYETTDNLLLLLAQCRKCNGIVVF